MNSAESIINTSVSSIIAPATMVTMVVGMPTIDKAPVMNPKNDMNSEGTFHRKIKTTPTELNPLVKVLKNPELCS